LENENKHKRIIENVAMISFGVLVVLISFFVVIQAQADAMQRTNNFCDEKYGEGNWYFKDITGTEEAYKFVGRLYIGQVWGCYNNSQ